jgi:hypothetical protein
MHFVLKAVQWSDIDLNRHFAVTHLFYLRATLNVVTVFVIIYLAYRKEPYESQTQARHRSSRPTCSPAD